MDKNKFKILALQILLQFKSLHITVDQPWLKKNILVNYQYCWFKAAATPNTLYLIAFYV